MENPTKVGRGFLSWLGTRFPRTNSCVHYFCIIYFLPSQEQSVRSGELTVCENQARTQFTPPLVSYTLKVNMYQIGKLISNLVFVRKSSLSIRLLWTEKLSTNSPSFGNNLQEQGIRVEAGLKM